MFMKAPLTSKEAMMRSPGSMSAMVSWRKMASCGDRPGMAPQRYVGMWRSRWGRMRRGRMVQTILTSVTAQTMGRQLSGLAQSPFLYRGRTRFAQSGKRGVCPVTMSQRRWARMRKRWAGRW